MDILNTFLDNWSWYLKLDSTSVRTNKYEHIGYTQEEVDKILNEVGNRLYDLSNDINNRGYVNYSTVYNNFLSRWNSTSMGTNTYLTLGSNPTRDMHAATKQYVDNAVGAVAGLSFMGPYNSFEDLPAQGDGSKIYLVSVASSESNNIYEEYIYINNSYELIGTTEVDLSDYLQSSDVVYTQYYQALTDANSGIKTGTLTVGSNSYDLYSDGEVGYTNSSTIMLPRYTKWIKTSAVGDKLWTDSFIFYTTNAASINSAGKIGSKAGTVVALDTTTSVSENSIYVGKISGGRLFCARLSGGSDANWNVSQGIANGLRDYVTVGANSFDSVGNFSTIEGTLNSAKGSNSHTEGLGNNAARAYMHVFGTYNVDPASGTTSGFDTKGTYVEIVGNGTANSARHNARTLDWSGNEVLAGKLTVGAAPTENMDVATKQYVDNAGTTHMVKGVDYVTAGQKADTTLGDKATAEGHNTTASGTYSHAEGDITVASGNRAHAEGIQTTASGSDSHAEGSGTTASGTYSHAEGSQTTASGRYSHAECGETTASGTYSHAEGYRAMASGNTSHAEGHTTTASGASSHAEGSNTTASGTYSHTEGLYTTAQTKSQHVFGEYNVLDVAGTTTTRGTYVEIVGNGTYDDSRSNARTLDWSGNEVLSGSLTSKGINSATNNQTANSTIYNTSIKDESNTSGYSTIDLNTVKSYSVSGFKSGKANILLHSDADNWAQSEISSTYSSDSNMGTENKRTILVEPTSIKVGGYNASSTEQLTPTYKWDLIVQNVGSNNNGKNEFHNLAIPTLTYDAANKEYVDNNLPNVLKFYYTTTSSDDAYGSNIRLPYKVDLPSDWENLILPSIRWGDNLYQIIIDINLQSFAAEPRYKYNSNGISQDITSTISGYEIFGQNMDNLIIDSTDGSIIYTPIF